VTIGEVLPQTLPAEDMEMAALPTVMAAPIQSVGRFSPRRPPGMRFPC